LNRADVCKGLSVRRLRAGGGQARTTSWQAGCEMQERAEGEEGGDRCGVPTFLYFPFLAVRYKRAPSSSSGWPGTGSWPSGDLVSLVGLVRDDLGAPAAGNEVCSQPRTHAPPPPQTKLSQPGHPPSVTIRPRNGGFHALSNQVKRVGAAQSSARPSARLRRTSRAATRTAMDGGEKVGAVVGADAADRGRGRRKGEVRGRG